MLVISFNSYKGGACRTTTCYNTLPYLAQKLDATSHQPILVFDVDLDSMGLTSLFLGAQSNSAPPKEYSARHLFVDDENNLNRDLGAGFFTTMEDDNAQKYFGYFKKIGNDLGLKDDGSVLFLGADANADVISDDTFKRMMDNLPFDKLLDTLIDMDKKDRPKAIVLDCAAGIQLSTLNILPSVDKAVVCMRPTTQFRIGTRDYLINKIPQKLMGAARKKREIVLVPTAVAPTTVAERDEIKRIEEEKRLKNLKNEVFDKIEDEIIDSYTSEKARGSIRYELNQEMVDRDKDIIGIPEIQRFKWTESELLHKLEQKETLSKQEQILKGQYIMLADILAKEI